MSARTVAHADESTQDSITGLFFTQLITEGEPGFIRGYHYKTLEEAKTAANVFNFSAGFTADEIFDVRISSMRLSRVW